MLRLASCCNEAFKIATTSNPYLDNYMMASCVISLRDFLLSLDLQCTGNDSLYTFTFEHEKRPECPVCGGESIEFEVPKDAKLERVMEMLTERQDMYVPPSSWQFRR